MNWLTSCAIDNGLNMIKGLSEEKTKWVCIAGAVVGTCYFVSKVVVKYLEDKEKRKKKSDDDIWKEKVNECLEALMEKEN